MEKRIEVAWMLLLGSNLDEQVIGKRFSGVAVRGRTTFRLRMAKGQFGDERDTDSTSLGSLILRCSAAFSSDEGISRSMSANCDLYHHAITIKS